MHRLGIYFRLLEVGGPGAGTPPCPSGRWVTCRPLQDTGKQDTWFRLLFSCWYAHSWDSNVLSADLTPNADPPNDSAGSSATSPLIEFACPVSTVVPLAAADRSL